MDPRLFIFNFVFCISIAISICLALYAIWKGGKKTVPVMLAVTNLSAAFFEGALLVGVNAASLEISQTAFLIALCAILISCFNIHWVLGSLGMLPEKRRLLAFFYSIAGALILFMVTFPTVFLENPSPWLYFPHYINPGPFFFLPIVFFATALCYIFVTLLRDNAQVDFTMKNRIRYFMIFTLGGYGLGSTAIISAYGIAIDPLISVFAPLFGIPLAYAALEPDILNLKEAAKRCLYYALIVLILTAITVSSIYINDYIVNWVSDFPQWLIPLIISIAVTFFGGIIWKRLQDTDILKYEFITVITHKLRTPLTHIKWSLESLRQTVLPAEREKFTDQIQKANSRLVDLTDILIGLVKVDSSDYQYHLETVAFEPLVQHVIEGVKSRAEEKHIKISFATEGGVPPVSVDVKRIQFVLQIILENAINYTPDGGSVAITLGWKKGKVVTTIHDTGIGMSRQELGHVFSKFYRGPRAKTQDTEGMGIGLYMAKSITERHGGKISVESGGEGQGTTFSVKLPPSVS